ncbi:sigma-70 family RNA polymerase sigma factor [Streptomyces sp. NPDC094143]|uniref:sigma-70 family RNA polymerase sigma factor n=1 Tax=Streptomyces sp. NPDC094143 TaxID=3155310 RepID=UPI00332F5027
MSKGQAAALVAQARSATAQADAADAEWFIRALYAEHGKALLSYAARQLGNDWHRAQDVLQDAAVRAWRHAGSLGLTPEAMRPWLFRVVRNLVIDDYRARALRPSVPDPLDDLLVSVGDDVDRLLTAHVVQEALEDLTAQQREILREMYFNGHSVAHVSELLGIPTGTVKSRSYYAMRALKKALTARGVLG